MMIGDFKVTFSPTPVSPFRLPCSSTPDSDVTTFSTNPVSPPRLTSPLLTDLNTTFSLTSVSSYRLQYFVSVSLVQFLLHVSHATFPHPVVPFLYPSDSETIFD